MSEKPDLRPKRADLSDLRFARAYVRPDKVDPKPEKSHRGICTYEQTEEWAYESPSVF